MFEPSSRIQIFANYSRSAAFPGFGEVFQTIGTPPTRAVVSAIRPQREWTAEIGTRGGAYSSMKVVPRPHSLPAEYPWSRRQTTRRIGAANPIVAKAGMRPVAPVAPAISSMVMTRALLRR
ncbi:hypothetical protein ACWKWJ_17210 [Sphingopyxis terrae subsp. ummariensis]